MFMGIQQITCGINDYLIESKKIFIILMNSFIDLMKLKIKNGNKKLVIANST